MEAETGWCQTIHHTRHIGDFRPWKDHDTLQESFDGLLGDLKA